MKYALSILIVFFCLLLVYAIYGVSASNLDFNNETKDLNFLWEQFKSALYFSLFRTVAFMAFLAFFPVGMKALTNEYMHDFILLIPFVLVCMAAITGAGYLLTSGGFKEMFFDIRFYGNVLIYSAQSILALFLSRWIIRRAVY